MNLDALPLSPLASAFAASLKRLAPDAKASTLLAAALCVEALENGQTCLYLPHFAGGNPWPQLPLRLPALADWQNQLAADSALVGSSGDYKPLILRKDRLYLARYEAYERQLAGQLLTRSQQTVAIDKALLKQSLERLFNHAAQSPDWQRIAAALALTRRLCLISGGPGTGKTSTVVRLLAALLEQTGGESLSIALVAPTGKAAARMSEAIRRAKAALPLDAALKDRLPQSAQTLHRLLGSREDRPQMRHHPGNPLPHDVLIVDEASMLDLALFAKLLGALKTDARLILLGDKDQLAAVEAGAVFADLCQGAGFSAKTCEELADLSGQPVKSRPPASKLGESVVLLKHSYRFAEGGGIGELARCINTGDAAGTLALLDQPSAELNWQRKPLQSDLLGRLQEAFAPYLAAATTGDAKAAFAAFGEFCLLCAGHNGAFGTRALNESLEERFKRQQKRPITSRWYAGRALIITRNNPALGLFNGDIGLCLPQEDGQFYIFFEQAEGFRRVSPGRLSETELAFAISVHKSQGSEFNRVLLALPEQPSPLLSRPLLYTAVTRAKSAVEIWGSGERLIEAIQTRAEHHSGLSERLAA
ncbi:exodeoxyribonuclease V subunit alpha [Ventosimonas gracilis]|uniref:RecBCD enzyme subunit RecD n=1 Tax=Ventosimonas gracilis TaxID=1680762 RepID=A0A139SY45_9GAMM|nr:exodeoxyribonuclease V subunit alpha [Ventosimonas gracilis]KXU39394.1 exodeoxyribonuclease V subunit alpha [Ventosimonas gracilis]